MKDTEESESLHRDGEDRKSRRRRHPDEENPTDDVVHPQVAFVTASYDSVSLGIRASLGRAVHLRDIVRLEFISVDRVCHRTGCCYRVLQGAKC